MPAQQSFAEEIRQEFSYHTMEVERLLVEVVREGRNELLTSERAYIAREMGWDADEIKRQLRRVNAILRLQAICGSPEDREAALNECQVATDLCAKEAPKIEQKIQELQQKLNSLQRDSNSAQRRCEQQAEAVVSLRLHVPAHIKEQVQQAVKVVEAGIGQDLRDAKSRHHELVCILNHGNVYESQEKHIEFGLKNLLPAAVITGLNGRTITRAYSPEWPALKADAEREFAEVNQRLPEIQAEYDEQTRQAEQPLDYYSTPEYQAAE